jgi:DNA-binding CsgD family transcriptional regulator
MNLLHNKFISEQALNQTRILELEKENIESELEKLTYYTVNRNRVLINYKTRLHSLSVKAKESVKKGLQLVISEIDKEISDDKEWKYIEPRLDKFYNSFITKLREAHPDLSLSEIKIATYVRMNLSTKEIAEFMNKTNRAIENDRYRLRKKINLESNESLQNYLMNL